MHDELEARVARLELEIRQMSEAIMTRELRVVDEAGRTRCALLVAEEGPRLILADQEGTMRLFLNLSEDGPDSGPGLALYDESGALRAFLHVSHEGPGLCLSSKAGRPRAALVSTRDGAALQLFSKAGRACLNADHKVGPDLHLLDKTGMLRAVVGFGEDGVPGIGFFDADGDAIE